MKLIVFSLYTILFIFLSACSGGGGGGGSTQVPTTPPVSTPPVVSPSTCTDSNATNLNGSLPCVCPVNYVVSIDGLTCTYTGGGSAPTYTYTQVFTSYSPIQSATTPCAGTVTTSRTMTCRRSDSVIVSNVFCSADPTPNSTVQSQAGSIVVSPTNSSLVNGSENMACAVGATTGTRSITCNTNYHLEGSSLATQNCYSNTRACSPTVTGASSSGETWNSGTQSYDSCVVNSCNTAANYIKVGNACVLCGANETANASNVCVSSITDAKLFFQNLSAIQIVSTTQTRSWGYNASAQLGLGDTTNKIVSANVTFPAGRYPKSITSNYNKTSMYAIMDNGSVMTWGANANGQLGDGTQVAKTTPTLISLGSKSAKKIITSSKGACAILTDNSMMCWGYNQNGELALGTTAGAATLTPTSISLGAGRTVYDAAFGDTSGNLKDMLCVITDDKALKCAGYNANGQLGDGTTTAKTSLTTISLGTSILAKKITFLPVAVDGTLSVCVSDSNDNLRCWGDNTSGKLGVGDTTYRNSPTLVNLGAGRTIKQVINSSIRYTVCGILDDNSLKCWGENSLGQVGDGTYIDRYYPVSINVGSGRTVKSLVNWANSVFAILDNDTLAAWGLNARGQLGTSNTTSQVSPQAINLGGKFVKSVAPSDYLTCILTTANTVMCAGDNTYGSVGVNATGGGIISTFGQLDFGVGRTATEVYTTMNSGCALLDNNSVKCWGASTYGQTGSNSTSSQFSPVLVQ